MEAERAYGRKVGIRVAPRTARGEQRTAVACALPGGADGEGWPIGHALRRLAGHVLDHAWEIEDRSG